MQADPVLFKIIPAKSGQIGLVTLNRPQALNALSGDLILALHKKLSEWDKDPTISVVITQGAGERAFCAGGDLKMVYEYGIDKFSEGMHFYETEYELDLIIAHFSKPYISLLNGIAMGGGLGIALHGTRTIATEKLQLAMPEVAIGFYPDVGAAKFFSRCPHRVGMYLGLTGNSIGAADALNAKLVDSFIPSTKLQSFIDELAKLDLQTNAGKTVDKLIDNYTEAPGMGTLYKYVEIIDECFAKNSIEEIIAALQATGAEWALQQVKTLYTRSPTSLKVAYRHLINGAKLSLEECLRQELILTRNMMQTHDIYEGIRAVLIDKTQDPKWQPVRLSDVKEQDINKLFE